jgi:hypothetical protein
MPVFAVPSKQSPNNPNKVLPLLLTEYKKDLQESCRLSSRRHTTARLFVSLLASLLILGVVAAELPELFSLVDDTSNDFVVRKASHGDAPTVNAPSHSSHQPGIRHILSDARDECAAGFVVAQPVPSELFLLHSVLRR